MPSVMLPPDSPDHSADWPHTAVTTAHPVGTPQSSVIVAQCGDQTSKVPPAVAPHTDQALAAPAPLPASLVLDPSWMRVLPLWLLAPPKDPKGDYVPAAQVDGSCNLVKVPRLELC